jgi:hypothetical protein
MRCLFVLALCLAACHAWAQPVEGSIVLNDGTTSKGLVSYSNLTGVVDFESLGGDVRQSQSARYNARNIAGFAYNGKQYYSIPFRSPSGVVKQFFEVVREYKDFAVISKTDLLSQRSVSEITTLYFMRASDFQVMPFLEVLDRDVKWRIFDSNKIQVRVLDSTLPEIIMGENFGKVRAFAKERKLAWHMKDSLISILDYYDSLIK